VAGGDDLRALDSVRFDGDDGAQGIARGLEVVGERRVAFEQDDERLRVGGVPVDPERRALEEPTAKRSGAPSPLTSTTMRPRWWASDSRPVTGG